MSGLSHRLSKTKSIGIEGAERESFEGTNNPMRARTNSTSSPGISASPESSFPANEEMGAVELPEEAPARGTPEFAARNRARLRSRSRTSSVDSDWGGSATNPSNGKPLTRKAQEASIMADLSAGLTMNAFESSVRAKSTIRGFQRERRLYTNFDKNHPDSENGELVECLRMMEAQYVFLCVSVRVSGCIDTSVSITLLRSLSTHHSNWPPPPPPQVQ